MKSKTFTFNSLPENVNELKSMPEADLKDPFATAALAVAVLCNYKSNIDETIAMLDYLKGPSPLSNYDKQFLRDRLGGSEYIPFSYFDGTSPDNAYTPSTPYTITVKDNPYSYTEENYTNLYLKSSGADNERPLKMRLKPSTGQWFLTEITILAGIRIPTEQDPWA